MSLINCPECGKEISDKSDKCINCGFPIRNEEHTTEKENYVFCNNCNTENNIGDDYCSCCGMRITPYSTSENNGYSNQPLYQECGNFKKKDSVLSIIAAVLSIFTITFFFGFIIALIDLGINDKTKRHLGSWFSVIFGIIIFIFLNIK